MVGSSTFNILGCLGLAGLVAGSEGLSVAPSLMAFDIWVMLAVALACLPIFLSGREIARWEGAVFLGYYAGLRVLPHPGRAAARRAAHLLGRDAGLCDPAHGRHLGGVAHPALPGVQ